MGKEPGFFKGVNLGGWLSQCDYSPERLDGFITEADFDQIARWGFDHVRLPVDYNVIQRRDGTMIEEGLERIDRAVAWAEAKGLGLVLDLHKTQGFSFDAGERESGFFENEAYQELFYQVWECFAGRYGAKPGRVMFDLLNRGALSPGLEAHQPGGGPPDPAAGSGDEDPAGQLPLEQRPDPAGAGRAL